MPADSIKTLVEGDNELKYLQFIANEENELILPASSFLPGVIGIRKDVYKKRKVLLEGGTPGAYVCFISKNGKPHSFFWKTSAKKIKKEGVRVGIIRDVESLTGRVISSFGSYKMWSYACIAKGYVSNTHILKMKLVDLFQERVEALQELESLEHTVFSKEEFQQVLSRYINVLTTIKLGLEDRFKHSHLSEFDSGAINKIKKDIEADIKKARLFEQDRRPYGTLPIAEFINRQIRANLYQIQGINQDITYSHNRSVLFRAYNFLIKFFYNFVMTRGKFNDCVEDALKIVDDYCPDPYNAVTQEHHGRYSTDDDAMVTHYFDSLTAADERHTLLAISLAEGCDTVVAKGNDPDNLYVQNELGQCEKLKRVAATKWFAHRNIKAFFKKIIYNFFNIVKVIFFFTRPWEEEAWDNEKFHLFATKLRKHAKPNEPLWSKPLKLVRFIIDAIKDCWNGMRNVGYQLWIKMPAELTNDWASSKELPDWSVILQHACQQMKEISTTEKKRLANFLTYYGLGCGLISASAKPTNAQFDEIDSLLKGRHGLILYKEELFTVNQEKQTIERVILSAEERARINPVDLKRLMGLFPKEKDTCEMITERLDLELIQSITKQTYGIEKQKHLKPTSILAGVGYHYHLTPGGDRNDILTALADGLNKFTSVFSHSINAKDPMGGLIFATAYLIGLTSILNPSLMTKLLGEEYVAKFEQIASAMSSSRLGAILSGCTTQAQLAVILWGMLTHGANSFAMETVSQFMEDPLTISAYFAAAYGTGYVMTNGIAGYKIPWLGTLLQEESPASYPFIGAKILLSAYRAFVTQLSNNACSVRMHFHGDELKNEEVKEAVDKRIASRFVWVRWLSVHASVLPKLSPSILFDIARTIDKLRFFSPEEKKSLKKILYPEVERSVAFQIFAIPLSYIPALLRVVVSIGLSALAWSKNRPFAAEPMKHAWSNLIARTKRDLGRAVICCSSLIQTGLSVVSSVAKVVAFIVNMVIGRLVACFNWHPGHAIHRGFAAVHELFRKVTKLFYPASIIKSSISAHPAHTIKTVEHSYEVLLKNFPRGSRNKKPISISNLGKSYASDLLKAPKKQRAHERQVDLPPSPAFVRNAW